MGRRIYAETVGIDKNDTYVHKFWFAVQDSDVTEYLDEHRIDNYTATADLSVSGEDNIKVKVAELKAQFEKEYSATYEKFMELEDDNFFLFHKDQHELASRINLGEHLLQTIENMKAKGIESQQLEIEL